jgi:hypothetical protein
VKKFQRTPYFAGQSLWFALFSTILLFAASCSEPDPLGLEVQPPADKINISFTDTVSVVSWVLREDSVASTKTSLTLLGSYYDPAFGITTAGFYSQFVLSRLNVLFENATIDSVVLCLPYSGYYGNTGSPLSIQVYEMDEAMSSGQVYYSNKSFLCKTKDLANGYTFFPHPDDSITLDTGKAAAHLRIPLDPSFGQHFLDAASSVYVSNEAFMPFFKGLYVTASQASQSGDGSILYFNPLSKAVPARLTLFYNDSLHFSFDINSSCTWANRFAHEYPAPSVAFSLLADSATGQQTCALKPMAGLRTKLYFPHLKNFANERKVVINKAELIIPVDKEMFPADTLLPPAKLALAGVSSTGGAFFLLDQYEGEAYFDGVYRSSEKKYVFNLARYVQQVIDGSIDDYGLYLMVSGSSIQANRVILYGGGHTANPIRLHLAFTVLN